GTGSYETGIYANRVTWADGAVSPMITVRDAAGVTEQNASVALSQTTGDFVVTYDLAGTSTFGVAQVNSANTVVAVYGPFSGFTPAVSIDGLNRYLITYPRYNGGTHSLDIFSRRDLLG